MAANAVALRGSLRSRLRVTAHRCSGMMPVRFAEQWETLMSFTIGHLAPVVALIAGILILIMPRLLNYIVAIYLIVIGIIGLGIFK